MNCMYNQSPEIYEDYLLNRLSEKEKKEFELHLSSCPLCQKELELARILITGIQEIGKQEMKAEIRRQIEQKKLAPAGFNWGILLRAAAVILFLVIAPGMIYYYWYFLPNQQQKLLTSFKERTDFTQQVPSTPEEKLDRKEEESGKEQLLLKDKSIEQQTEPNEQMIIENKVVGADQVPAQLEADREKRLTEAIPSPAVTAGTSSEIYSTQPEKKLPATVFIFDSSQILIEKGGSRSSTLSKSAAEQPLVPVSQFWQYRQNAQTIQISVQEIQTGVSSTSTAELPEKFPVQIISTHYPNLQMIWQLDTTRVKFDPSQLQMIMDSTNYLMVQWPSGATYRIDTRQQNTEAVRIKP